MASDQLSVARFIGSTALVAVVFVTAAWAQNLGNLPCNDEIVQPNVVLNAKHHLSGILKDPTGAVFEKSKVIVRRQVKKGKFSDYRATVTDQEGRFDLGVVEIGACRFLPAPHRGWKQPKEVTCGESLDCEINFVLEVNPTDMPFAKCPIQ